MAFGARLRVRGEAFATKDRLVHPVFPAMRHGASGPAGPIRPGRCSLDAFP